MAGFLYFLLIGLCAGWLAGQLTKGGGFGVVGNIIIGVIGALIGGVLARVIGLMPTSVIGELICATVGAIALLAILQAIASRRA